MLARVDGIGNVLRTEPWRRGHDHEVDLRVVQDTFVGIQSDIVLSRLDGDLLAILFLEPPENLLLLGVDIGRRDDLDFFVDGQRIVECAGTSTAQPDNSDANQFLLAVLWFSTPRDSRGRSAEPVSPADAAAPAAKKPRRSGE